jgi:pimeloyl-ACP methyl ester carboxylesterase
MKKYLSLLLCIFSIHTFAEGTFTNLEPGVRAYSEYYPNNGVTFKGTILFINGSGSDISVWKSPDKKLFNCAKKLGSLFFYERNGIGKSPPDFQISGAHPITAPQISERLSLLLKKQNIKPPYLVVAHSHGALYAGYFTLKNPDSVMGLLLVDPLPRNANFSEKAMVTMRDGINEAKTKTAHYMYKKYPGSLAEGYYQLLGLNESKRAIKELGDINNHIPVVILSSIEMEKFKPMQEDWFKSQQLWLNKNPASKIISVPADHFIQITKPLLVCDELKYILNKQTRTGS